MFGYKPDPVELRRLYVKWAHRFGIIASPPPRDLLSLFPYVLAQKLSSCTGHGTSVGLYAAAGVAGAALGFVPSPYNIYRNGVAIGRGDPLGGALQDSGAMPSDVARALSEFGVSALLPTGALTDDIGEPGGTLVEPDLAELEREGQHIYVGWYAVSNADEARSAIAAGAPVGIGTYVDSSFINWTKSQKPLGLMNFNDPNGGGHWTCLGATTAAGTFRGRNSWDTTYGDEGDYECTDDFVNQASQLIAFGYRRIGS